MVLRAAVDPMRLPDRPIHLQAYPNAKVILTVRDESEWFESVQAAKRQLDTEACAVGYSS